MPPYVIVVEGTRDVSTVCAEVMVKLNHSLAFEGVVWIHRNEDEPVGLESDRSKALMRSVNRYEFDVALYKKMSSPAYEKNHHLFILSGYYDVGFWRRTVEIPIVPHIVFYVEFTNPTEDPKRASFVKFARGLGLRDVRHVAHDDLAVLEIVNGALDLLSGPDVARV